MRVEFHHFTDWPYITLLSTQLDDGNIVAHFIDERCDDRATVLPLPPDNFSSSEYKAWILNNAEEFSKGKCENIFERAQKAAEKRCKPKHITLNCAEFGFGACKQKSHYSKNKGCLMGIQYMRDEIEPR